ncbi:MAG: LptF/LptG family permease [Alphaproteobacteria bacterium]|nr:LptF/LptG family permease [Alphaproteobacteria bacterium]
MLLPTTLPRYVATQAALATVVAASGLLALVWLLQSLRFLDFLVNKGLGVGVFFNITSLLVPRLLLIILPLAVLVGVGYAARRLQDDYEVTAWLASGASPRIAWLPLLGWGALVSGVLYVVMLLVQPASVKAFKELQLDLRTRQGQLLLEEGTFNPLGEELMVYIKRRLSPTSFEQLLVHDTRDPATPVTWYARFGSLQDRGQGHAPQLLLQQGIRQEAGPRQTSMLEFASYNLDLSPQLGAVTLKAREPEVEELPLQQAWQTSQASTTPPRRAAQLQAEVVNRLSWPLLPLPLAMVALAALLHPAKRKQSSVRGAVAAGVAGVAVMGAQFGWLAQAQGGASWALGMMLLWPLVASLAAAYWWWRASQP